MPRRKINRPTTLGEFITEMGHLYRDSRMGRLDSLTAVRLASILSALRQAFEGGQFEERLQALEKTAKEPHDDKKTGS